MELKQIKRSTLSEALKKAKDQFKTDAFFTTSIRATKDGSLQLEVCQNRRLGGRQLTMLGMLNRSDERFRDENTLLFDWMTMKPHDFFAIFPSLKGKVTEADLKAISETWKESDARGKDAPVYKFINNIKTVHNVMDGKDYHPIIIVTEMTETELRQHEFYKGADADEKVAVELEEENNVMKTATDGEYLVSPENGDRVFRFVRTTFVEEGAVDKIIAGKLPKSQYEKRGKKIGTVKQTEPENVVLDIEGDDSI